MTEEERSNAPRRRVYPDWDRLATVPLPEGNLIQREAALQALIDWQAGDSARMPAQERISLALVRVFWFREFLSQVAAVPTYTSGGKRVAVPGSPRISELGYIVPSVYSAYWRTDELEAALRAARAGEHPASGIEAAPRADSPQTPSGDDGDLAKAWAEAKGNRQRRHEIAVVMRETCGGNVSDAARRLAADRRSVQRALEYETAARQENAAPQWAPLARNPQKH